jgi:hypothetical protein
MDMSAMSDGVQMGAQAVGIVTRVSPAIGNRTLTEGYLTQPAFMASGAWLGGALRLHAMINLEGLTLKRGELNAGVWGEGYMDRRHPHTYLHEAVVAYTHNVAGVAASLSAGRGFAPFGTDDPMVRGFVKYPANHHLSQILERWVLIGGVRRGPVVFEAGTFNGDEPTGPRSLGKLSRFGDSWSGRVTLLPIRGVELQASDAHVTSPELFSGGGLDQRKLNFSARIEREINGTRIYGLSEYAHTVLFHQGHPGFVFSSYLTEASATRSGWNAAARYEVTVRPEEERLRNPFRSVRPPTDNSIAGRTRWQTASLHLARSFDVNALRAAPFIEVQRSHAEALNPPAVYEPQRFYGSNVLWTVSAGLRVAIGMIHTRMGRYGVAESSGEHRHNQE